MASLQVSKVKCNFSEPTETRGFLAYGYEHLIASSPTEKIQELMVAVGIPSEQIVRDPRTSGGLAGSHESDFSARANLMKHQAALDLAQQEVEEGQEDLRNEVEPAIQKRKEVPTRPTYPTTQPPPLHQPPIPTPSASYSNPVNPHGHCPKIEAGPSTPNRLSPGLGLVPWTFDHPSEDVLEFENDKERARRLLVNTHRLLGAHFFKRGWEMDGLLTHAITQLSYWYETLEVENYEGFEWDDSHNKIKAEDSP
ncbi:hypothetical protein PPACK8108_LOCUS24259 [Phakopsora pachyrhizi]|uniref:Uncharacterized protein n=1 Tax=Phakopsora pachyrhizi TaxID=170000 RepID=A0AAV0BPE5_PHAPC|nr:hypothetical protein PPACK8108_LOCUS24259 [Phakopsora pachyrhizi]